MIKFSDLLVESEKIGFDEFSAKRLKGATKISEDAKKKCGSSMLTYHHFVVKLPYYKKASEGKFKLDEAKTEFKENIDKLCKLTETVDIEQVEFQKLVGLIEVLGELIIKHK